MAGYKHGLIKPNVSTDRIVELYRSGLNSYEIAPIVGLAQPTIINRLMSAGEPRRSRWEQYAKNVTPAEAVAMYQSGMNAGDVARAAGVTRATVKNKVKQAGFTIRPCKTPIKFGPANPCWKGGRFIRNGYVSLSIGGKYVLEHRIVMERHLGRPLTKVEIVHHLNGIRDDNRPENLALTTLHEHEHYTYVKCLQARIRELEVINQEKTSFEIPAQAPSCT